MASFVTFYSTLILTKWSIFEGLGSDGVVGSKDSINDWMKGDCKAISVD